MTATLTIFGATGYTGRLCTREAVDRGVPVRLAGRREGALERLAAEVGAADIAVADTADADSLRALAASSDVLLSAVGPYERHGRAVVDAAIAGGCHYLDVTGEAFFLDWVHRQDLSARRAGVTLLPAAGFDGALGDIVAGIAHAALGEPVTDARVAYLVRRGRWSAGTARSVLSMADRGSARGQGTALETEPVFADRWKVPFPEPLGPRDALSLPMPEIVTLGRTVGAERTRTYLVTPGAAVIGPPARLLVHLARLGARTPAWKLAQRAADVLPEGPDAPARHATRCAVLVDLQAATGGTRAAWVRLRDPYGATARISVALAQRVLDGRAPRSGALTPAQLLAGGCVGFLGELGLDWALLDPEAAGEPAR